MSDASHVAFIRVEKVWDMAINDNNMFGRWLDVIQSISGENEMSVSGIAEILGCSPRNAYYVLKSFERAGFIVCHRHGMYSISQQSPFFMKLIPTVTFSREQAIFLYKALEEGGEAGNPLAGLLMRKLRRYYGLNDIEDIRFQPKAYRNMSILQRAIKWKRVVVLHEYSSSNSKTVSDRTVEPFLLVGDNTDVRAYELSSGKNKTFKISRIGMVEMLGDDWKNEDKHKEMFTDMFMFSGEERHRVRLRLDVMAHNLMQEEYPHSEPMMAQDDKTHWIFETDVVSYIAIGRFILGLYENVEVLEDDGLRKYLDDKISKMRT